MNLRDCLINIALLAAASIANAEDKPVAPLTPEQQLVQAAFTLDVDRVKDLISQKVGVNARMGKHPDSLFKDKWSGGWPVASAKWTPLIAVASSHREPPPEKEFKNTLEALDEGEKERAKIDPKLIAERDSRRVAIAKVLIAAKANLDLDDGYGATALAEAVYNDYEALAILLIEAGAKVNTKTGIYIDGTGDITPLQRSTGNPKVLEALIKHGADVNARDGSGATALHWVALGAGSEWLRAAIARSKKDKGIEKPAAPLPTSKYAECARLLIAAGADVNVKDKEGKTALSWVGNTTEIRFPGDEEKKQVADLLRKAGAK